MEDKILCGDGILEQIKQIDFYCKPDPWAHYRQNECHLKAIDIGEYSVFVKEDLSGVKGIRVYGEGVKLLESQEILPSEKGSMIYFDNKVADIIKPNHKFRASVYRSWWEMIADGYFWDETMYK
jgi:hypothetical protein